MLEPMAAPYCERCSAPLTSVDEVCADCEGRTFHFMRARTALVFNETAQEMIHLLKYRGKRGVGRYLGRYLGEAVAREVWRGEIDILIPLPLYATRRRERGYNQSEVIAQSVAERLALPLRTDLVIRHRHTPSQTSLSTEQRRENVRGVFRVTRASAVAKQCIALVDDVFTTGATLDSCARTLLDAGADAVYALAVARA